MAITVGVRSGHNRFNAADSNTNWGNWGSTGPAPAAETQLGYQNNLAVNKKITSTSLGGEDYDPGSGGIDVTAAATALILAKVIVADSFDLNATRGLVFAFGSSNAQYRAVCLAGTASTNDAFKSYRPAGGGYIIVAIDPDTTFWHDGTVTSGTVTYTAIDWFGAQCAMINGLAKAENLAVDAIDVGRGLFLYGSSPDGKYQDFVDWDEGIGTNRYGFVTSAFGMFFVRGMLTVGRNGSDTATATTFTTDLDTVVVYPDMFVSAGLLGTTVDLGAAGTHTIQNTQICRGKLYNSGALDTRGDFIFTGTTGTGILSGTLTNFRNITLTSAVTVTAANIECQLLTQASADIEGLTTIRTKTITQVACVVDPTLGSSTGLNNSTFQQTGVGHAIEFTTTTTRTLTNIGFTGYGGTPGTNSTPSSGANDAAILNSSGGALTINISGGDVPSIRNTSGSTTTVVNTVDYALVGMNDGTELTILDRDVEMLDITGSATTLSFGNATATERMGQSFQVAATAKAERIRIRLRKVGTPTDGVTIRLVNGVPGSTLLAESVVLEGADITTSFVEYDIDLTEKNSLTLSTTYGLEIQRTGAVDGSNYYQIEYDTSDVHASGVRYIYNAGWGSSTGDLLLTIMEAASDNSLFHVESSSGTETYTHGGTVKEVEVLALHTDYLPIVVVDALGAADSNVTLTQTPDRVFSNP